MKWQASRRQNEEEAVEVKTKEKRRSYSSMLCVDGVKEQFFYQNDRMLRPFYTFLSMIIHDVTAFHR